MGMTFGDYGALSERGGRAVDVTPHSSAAKPCSLSALTEEGRDAAMATVAPPSDPCESPLGSVPFSVSALEGDDLRRDVVRGPGGPRPTPAPSSPSSALKGVAAWLVGALTGSPTAGHPGVCIAAAAPLSAPFPLITPLGDSACWGRAHILPVGLPATGAAEVVGAIAATPATLADSHAVESRP